MLRIYKIIKDNKINVKNLSKLLKYKGNNLDSILRQKLLKIRDFTLDELQKLYDYLLENKYISSDMDIGELLDEEDEEPKE